MGVDTDLLYGDIRSELEGAGALIGHTDLLIASHARYFGLTLIPAYVKGFSYLYDCLWKIYFNSPLVTFNHINIGEYNGKKSTGSPCRRI